MIEPGALNISQSESSALPCQLVLVMPVYNEEACIAKVIEDWRGILSHEVGTFRMLILDDGSTDATGDVLTRYAGDPSITLIQKPNSGHGPTILQGYRKAVDMAQWVFQCDSDDEIPADEFPKLWKARQRYDFLFGVRRNREQNAGRRLISAVSRLTVRALFGSGVEDVNTPYRLMRAKELAPIISQIPDDTFAPNVLISGIAARRRKPILNIEVPHRGRRTGSASIVKWTLWRSAFRAFYQTFVFALKVR